MRPIDQDSQAFAYSSVDALAREVISLVPSTEEGEPPKAVKSTVGAQVERLETLLAASFDPGGKWTGAKETAEAARLTELIGDGYQAAAGELIDRTGPYCAYCEAAEPTGLSVDPVKPAGLFPKDAFDPANLLLACSPCRDRKRAYLTRTAGSLASIDGPVLPSWPHRYWKGLPSPSRLPFRHRLYESRGGGSADRRPVSIDRARQLVAAYRQGRFDVEQGARSSPRLVLRPSPAGRRARGTKTPNPVSLAAWVEAEGGPLPGGGDPQGMIDMLDLNCLAGNPGDRRQEMRTRAWLVALDSWERLDSMDRIGAPDEDLRATAEGLRDQTIRATGFWGVWLQVFRDTPGFQQRLAGLLPGTAPSPLWEM
jgi:hypothetical protein